MKDSMLKFSFIVREESWNDGTNMEKFQKNEQIYFHSNKVRYGESNVKVMFFQGEP